MQVEEEKSSESKDTSASFTLTGQTERQLSNIELIRKAEDLVDKLSLEKAVSLLEEGIRRFPNDTVIID